MLLVQISTSCIPNSHTFEVMKHLSMQQSQQHISIQTTKTLLFIPATKISIMSGLIMGGIVKLHVQVCKGSGSPCIIRDRLKISEVPQISDIHIGGTLVSEEHDTHQV